MMTPEERELLLNELQEVIVKKMVGSTTVEGLDRLVAAQEIAEREEEKHQLLGTSRSEVKE